tara:strand:- start:1062 stop:1442 length:381 start_codon:yes stop_codon:yes gene_type:complete
MSINNNNLGCILIILCLAVGIILVCVHIDKSGSQNFKNEYHFMNGYQGNLPMDPYGITPQAAEKAHQQYKQVMKAPPGRPNTILHPHLQEHFSDEGLNSEDTYPQSYRYDPTNKYLSNIQQLTVPH